MSLELHSASGTITRPTEAQLKWALLHHRRVALAVQSYVRRLYLYPQSLKDVPGGLTELDVVDDIDDPVELASGRTVILVSQGRLALLRMSQRAYEQRKCQIMECGFKNHRSCSDCESDDSSCHSCDSDVQRERRRTSTDRVFGNLEKDNENATEIQDQIIFLPTNVPVASTVRRKRFRQRRRKFQPRCSDPERVRRFKEAFQAALHALELATNQDRFQVSPTSSSGPSDMPHNSKRRTWTRPESDSASRFPDDSYSVWGCSTVMKRQPAVHNPTLTPGKAPLDRSATWLQLLNVGSGVKNNTPRRDSLRTPMVGGIHDIVQSADRAKAILTPALRQHVADVAREIFSGDRNQAKTNLRRSPSPSLETLERDVSSFVEQFEQHIASTMVETVISSDSSRVYTPSLRHSDFGMSVGTPFVSVPQADRIAPVVTYDSDDGVETSALDESAITRNPYETFTIQVLDNSFSCWNASSTDMVDDHDKHVVLSNSAPDLDTNVNNDNSSIDVQRDTSVTSSSHMAAENVSQGNVEVLEMSPMNFKRILELLPDRQELDVAPLSVVKTNRATNEQQQVLFNLKNDSLIESREDSETLHHSQPDLTRMSSLMNLGSIVVGSRLMNASQHSVRVVDHPVKVEKVYCSAGWNPVMTPIPGNSSAGCGLFSERASHFNVQWEKRWML
jgi:hypothetical protein